MPAHDGPATREGYEERERGHQESRQDPGSTEEGSRSRENLGVVGTGWCGARAALADKVSRPFRAMRVLGDDGTLDVGSAG